MVVPGIRGWRLRTRRCLDAAVHMLEERLLDQFAEGLRAQVMERLPDLDAGTPLPEHAALAEVLIGYLGDAGVSAEYELCPHEDSGPGSKPCRILAYALPEDSSRLELFTGMYVSEDGPQVLPKGELGKLAGWAIRFCNYAVDGNHKRFAGNEAAASAARVIQERQGRIQDVRVHILTNARVRDREVDAITAKGRTFHTTVWDLERVQRVAGESGGTRAHIDVDFAKLMGRPISCLEMKPPAKEYQTFLVVVPGDVVFRLYEDYGATLFEFNVRSFLQARGQVNKGLRDTIRDQPERFLAYNNGLTATADEIEVGQWGGETVIHRLRGLQIVNGAQTTASIHRAVKEDRLPVDRLAVSMKLTRVEPSKLDEFVPLIARYANTQNPVQLADLSATGPFQIGMEQLSNETWCPGEESRWFYERARGAYHVARARHPKKRVFDAEQPKEQAFGKTDLAKFLMSWWQLPHVVSRGSQKNFGMFMAELQNRYGSGWSPNAAFFRDAVAAAIIFNAAKRAVRRQKLPSYGANVVTYMVAKLAADHGELDLSAVWDAQELSLELVMVLEAWVAAIHSIIVTGAGVRNVTEWCKKEGCWEQVQATTLPFPVPPPPEFRDPDKVLESDVGGRDPAGRSGDDGVTDEMQACRALDGPAWAAVMQWASVPGRVAAFDVRVSHTLMGMALGGWPKLPTAKQAKFGARVIAAARHAGALPSP